jgi:plasmid stabilization system protein ParE
MVWKVKFSTRAEKNLIEILKYLKENWSLKTSKDFIAILNKKISNIKTFPYSYKSIEDRKNIRKCTVIKQVSLYYEVRKADIIIITLFDNRQDPDKLNLP